MSAPLAVEGWARPGFEPVAEVFSRSDLGRGGGAFAAYVEGAQVVDLWAGEAAPGVPWHRDTLTTSMSASKGLAAMCLLLLHDRGVLDVEAPVARYWPEYAQAGKEQTLVRHVLNHTSGMLCFQDPGSLLDWSGNGWDDYDEIAARIAFAPPAWEPGTRIGYHAISVGWLCQELVRRVTGVTLGEFFAKELAGPLGLSVFIGTPEPEQPRLAALISELTPPTTPALQAAQAAFLEVLHDPAQPLAQAFVLMHGQSMFENMEFLNLPNVRSAQIPAANASTDARGLARAYSLLAEGGLLEGTRLLSEDSIRLFGTLSFTGLSGLDVTSGALKGSPRTEMRYALGFEGDFGLTPKPWRFGPSQQSFGHLGAGGQIGFSDPVHRVAAGFVRNHLTDWEVSTKLVDTLYACLGREGP